MPNNVLEVNERCTIVLHLPLVKLSFQQLKVVGITKNKVQIMHFHSLKLDSTCFVFEGNILDLIKYLFRYISGHCILI